MLQSRHENFMELSTQKKWLSELHEIYNLPLPPMVFSIASLIILLTSSTTNWFCKEGKRERGKEIGRK